jgi:N-acetylmuramoyl-L-alanine amidase
MKYAIDYGHGLPTDGGANGVVKEEKFIDQVGQFLKDKLTQNGHSVILTRPMNATSPTDSLSQRCKTANNNNVDKFISIHFNAFSDSNAHGTEISRS